MARLVQRERNMTEPGARAAALQEADHCVKCGLCLPHCPTYRLYRTENESPRGRIALTEGLLSGHLEADDPLRRHIDHCLLCRNCERHCPSGVRFSRILDVARAELGSNTGLARWLDNPLASSAARIAAGIPLPGSLGRLARALPHSATGPACGTHEPRSSPRGRIGLLLGCVTQHQQAGALNAAVTLLNALSYTVEIPEGQGCCGALAAHQGNPQLAARQVTANREAFGKADRILAIASACALQMRETMAETHPMDIVTFLADELTESNLRFQPPEGAVSLHVPCTLHNGLRETESLIRLLKVLPESQPTLIGEAGDCCGAGGTHLLTQREQAEQLRKPFLEKLLELAPRYLLTTNIGCALHLAEGALKAGIKVEVLHPTELLARCLITGVE